jgi:hypothetical protein
MGLHFAETAHQAASGACDRHWPDMHRYGCAGSADLHGDGICVDASAPATGFGVEDSS